MIQLRSRLRLSRRRVSAILRLLGAFPALFAALILAFSGCVTRREADLQARRAFMAGQQAAMARLQQTHGPSVTFVGEVAIPVIPWTPDLTLARALVTADYRGAVEPREILIVRAGRAMQVDPRQLLRGEDVPLLAGDVVDVRPAAARVTNPDPRFSSPDMDARSPSTGNE